MMRATTRLRGVILLTLIALSTVTVRLLQWIIDTIPRLTALLQALVVLEHQFL